MKKEYVYIIIAFIGLVLVFFILYNRDDTKIVLNEGSEITVYEGEKYYDPGYTISGSTDVSEYYVLEDSNVDIKTPGNYKITYYLYNGNNKLITKITRKVKVEKLDVNDINLTLIGDGVEYYFKGTYSDKGAIAIKNNQDISYLIDITSNVQNVPGEYEVIYKIGNGIEKRRKVIITELNIQRELDSINKKIKIKINNLGYEYTILPDGTKKEENSFEFNYTDKGKYKLDIYLKSGSKIEHIVDIASIDSLGPVGTCIAEMENNNSFKITVDAKDESGIKKYQYDNQDYTTNSFNITNTSGKIIIRVYDNNDNETDITCKNVYGLGYKSIKPSSEKLGNAKCNTDINDANRQLEELMQSYGEKTRSAVAAAALFLTNYNYNIEYQWGGKYLKKGLNPEWGCAKYTMLTDKNELKCGTVINSGSQICNAGLDCTGFTSWAFFQAGFDKSIIRTSSQSTALWGNFNASKYKYAFSSSNIFYANQIKPGDLVWSEGHVGIVIGVDENTVQIANEPGPIGTTIIKKTGGRVSGNWYFTHFVLFDEFYKMYGSNT